MDRQCPPLTDLFDSSGDQGSDLPWKWYRAPIIYRASNDFLNMIMKYYSGKMDCRRHLPPSDLQLRIRRSRLCYLCIFLLSSQSFLRTQNSVCVLAWCLLGLLHCRPSSPAINHLYYGSQLPRPFALLSRRHHLYSSPPSHSIPCLFPDSSLVCPDAGQSQCFSGRFEILDVVFGLCKVRPPKRRFTGIRASMVCGDIMNSES